MCKRLSVLIYFIILPLLLSSCLFYEEESAHHIVSCELGMCIKKCMHKEKDVIESEERCYLLYLAGVFASSEEEIKSGNTSEVKLYTCLGFSNLCYE